ncbi:heterokaryon incompatibility protein-domain-containing protein [Staphylotrichum tortipilum]|uniref:Heterokaryon incompatibility protein-domain-containing protein n=1 Tax=Staphylotrichum tortipilum TaxID=2831512 RepID=A0AAN6MBM2_9PEZI|nr:heterokaryon incompatibility protein-domain-containing protein [Staphylotrichum longicolle]
MAAIQDAYAKDKTSTVLSGLGQQLVALSDDNKNALLSEPSKTMYDGVRRIPPDEILSRLNGLNPEVGRQFRLKKDVRPDVRLRMLCPAPSPGSIYSPVPSYIAVSYCWHYPKWRLAAAATPVYPGWEISEPMIHAVMALRQTPDEGVWLDKLCINQDDPVDKEGHIALMDTIYHSARRVVILLEDIQLTKDEEEAGLAYRGFYEDLVHEVEERGLRGDEKGQFVDQYFPKREQQLRDDGRGHVMEAVRAFAMNILGARWYNRAWCAHESRMAKFQKVNNPLFICFGADGGVLGFEFRFIHYLGLHLSGSEPEPPIGLEFMGHFNDPDPKTLRQRWWRIQKLMPDSTSDVSSMQHLVNILSFGCMLKGDLMSIALNTAGIPLSFCGNEATTVEEVIWKFSLLMLACGDLVPLVTEGQKLRVPTPKGNIISWAVHPHQGVQEDHFNHTFFESLTAVTQDYVELDLLVFESLPLAATAESKAKADAFVNTHHLDALGDQFLDEIPEPSRTEIPGPSKTAVQVFNTTALPINRSATSLPTFRRNILSLALDNGIDWVITFPGSIYTATKSGWLHGPITPCSMNMALLPFHKTLTTLAEALLSLFPPRSPSPYKDTDPPIHHLRDFLSVLLDPRLLLLAQNTRRLPVSTRLGRALLTAAASNTAYIAIPRVLLRMPDWHERAWIIEPFDPDTETPENWPGDLLPPKEMRIVKDDEVVQEGKVPAVEDVVPVLGSDCKDKRRPMGAGNGRWRLRTRQAIFGAVEDWWERGGFGEGNGAVWLERQRVYGAEDYPWGEMQAAFQRAVRRGEVEEEGGGPATKAGKGALAEGKTALANDESAPVEEEATASEEQGKAASTEESSGALAGGAE